MYAFVDSPDRDQLRAIQACTGPVRVLAPAGSGKTRVLTNRVLELLNRGVQPAAILALAFNRKAAGEMAGRLNLAGVPVTRRLDEHGVTVRTLHALGHDIVRRAYGCVYHESNRRQVNRIVAGALGAHAGLTPGTYDAGTAVRSVKQHLAKVKAELTPLEDYSIQVAGRRVPFLPIFRQVEHQLRLAGCIGGYEDMLYWGVRALHENDSLRRELQSRFVFLLIDEFQDLNPCQLRLAEVVAAPQDNLFAVGDDDQMIYGWRGASVTHLLEFDRRHSAVQTFVLRTNYRSTQHIVRCSQQLIAHNRRRYPKSICPRPDALPGTVELAVAHSPGLLARRAATWIRQRHQAGRQWQEFAVLTRYRCDHYTIAVVFDRLGIPHSHVDPGTILGSLPGRVVQAYLGALFYPEQTPPSLWRVLLMVPGPKAPRHLVDRVHNERSLQQLAAHPWADRRTRRQIANLLGQLADFRRRFSGMSRSPGTVVRSVLAEFAIKAHFLQEQRDPDHGSAGLPDSGDHVLLCEAMIAVAAEHRTMRRLWTAMAEHGSAAALADGDSSTEGVTIATMHATKGEQYPCVVLHNVARPRRADRTDMEEERRVHYVGATRAESELLVTAPPAPQCSPFVSELLGPDCPALIQRKFLHGRMCHMMRRGLAWLRQHAPVPSRAESVNRGP